MSYQKKVFIISLCLLILAQDTMQFWGGKKKKDGGDEKKDGGSNPFKKFFGLDKKKEDKKPANQPPPAAAANNEQPQPVVNANVGGAAESPPAAQEDPNKPQEEGPACDKKTDDIKAKIVELRTALEGKVAGTSDVSHYMKGDNYLMRWLIAGDLDVKQAENLVTQHVLWRDQNKIDDLDSENFGDLDKSYNVDHNGNDKVGRPVVEWWLSDWDVAAALGKPEIGIAVLVRWLARILEFTAQAMFELNVEKKICVTQAVLLVSLKDANAAKQGCEQCLQLWAIFAQLLEIHYPHLFFNVHFANAGNDVAVTILKAMIGALKNPQKTAASWKTYKDDAETSAALGQLIDANQRSAKFGGTLA